MRDPVESQTMQEAARQVANAQSDMSVASRLARTDDQFAEQGGPSNERWRGCKRRRIAAKVDASAKRQSLITSWMQIVL